MQQVKIFKGIETDTATLESEVNAWLRASDAKIVSITGNIAPQSPKPGAASGGLGHGVSLASDVIIIVLYETSA